MTTTTLPTDRPAPLPTPSLDAIVDALAPLLLWCLAAALLPLEAALRAIVRVAQAVGRAVGTVRRRGLSCVTDPASDWIASSAGCRATAAARAIALEGAGALVSMLITAALVGAAVAVLALLWCAALALAQVLFAALVATAAVVAVLALLCAATSPAVLRTMTAPCRHVASCWRWFGTEDAERAADDCAVGTLAILLVLIGGATVVWLVVPSALWIAAAVRSLSPDHVAYALSAAGLLGMLAAAALSACRQYAQRRATPQTSTWTEYPALEGRYRATMAQDATQCPETVCVPSADPIAPAAILEPVALVPVDLTPAADPLPSLEDLAPLGPLTVDGATSAYVHVATAAAAAYPGCADDVQTSARLEHPAWRFTPVALTDEPLPRRPLPTGGAADRAVYQPSPRALRRARRRAARRAAAAAAH